jgi:hypothetical protein
MDLVMASDKPKSPQATRRKVPKIMFSVRWDPTRRRYVAEDDGGSLLGLSQTKGIAMGTARTAAINAAKERRATVSVLVENDGGKMVKQWTFAPPTKGYE